jgi:hypothetical protein
LKNLDKSGKVKMLKLMKKLFFSLWCFPQELIGSILCELLICDFMCEYKQAVIYETDYFWARGVSCGRIIIVKSGCSQDRTLIKHEYGHTIQSFYLGWLYLFIVGIPSSLNVIACRIFPKLRSGYYNRFPENWADRLGGVKKRGG